MRTISLAAMTAFAELLVRPAAGLQQMLPVPGLDVASYAAIERQLASESQSYARLAPLTYRLNHIGRMAGAGQGSSARAGSGGPDRGWSDSSSSSSSGRGSASSASSSSSGSSRAGESFSGSWSASASGSASSSSAGSWSSSAASQGSGSSSGAGGGEGGAWAESYEQLMKRPARELKRMLVDRSVNCADCYEKSDLARRIVESRR